MDNEPMRVKRAKRVVDAAVNCYAGEWSFSASDGKGRGEGGTAAKRELEEAVAEYLRYHLYDKKADRVSVDTP